MNGKSYEENAKNRQDNLKETTGVSPCPPNYIFDQLVLTLVLWRGTPNVGASTEEQCNKSRKSDDDEDHAGERANQKIEEAFAVIFEDPRLLLDVCVVRLYLVIHDCAR